MLMPMLQYILDARYIMFKLMCLDCYMMCKNNNILDDIGVSLCYKENGHGTFLFKNLEFGREFYTHHHAILPLLNIVDEYSNKTIKLYLGTVNSLDYVKHLKKNFTCISLHKNKYNVDACNIIINHDGNINHDDPNLIQTMIQQIAVIESSIIFDYDIIVRSYGGGRRAFFVIISWLMFRLRLKRVISKHLHLYGLLIKVFPHARELSNEYIRLSDKLMYHKLVIPVIYKMIEFKEHFMEKCFMFYTSQINKYNQWLNDMIIMNKDYESHKNDIFNIMVYKLKENE